ncbi:group II intron maturase-specific domain-containing protein [Paenibacillus sp. FSL R7-0312]|uniref:group II intron maturase-specific domain-containing protein n=1 Tax=Paenibacillus sp. FSL R7-0312 TaxID=2921682 RepID=UPI00404086E2
MHRPQGGSGQYPRDRLGRREYSLYYPAAAPGLVGLQSTRKFTERVGTWLKSHRHWKRRDQQKQLTRMLQGFYQYFALYHCDYKLHSLKRQIERQWVRVLRRRSQRHRLYWSYLRNRDWF